MRKIALMIGLSLAAVASGALAQGGPRVHVNIGPALERKAGDYGAEELTVLRGELGHEVGSALARNNSPIVAVDLTIEDANPNRPTMSQMARTPGLSLSSIGVGGARLSGVATFADGHTQPIRYQWFETDIRNEQASSTWTDAERSFMYLADDLARGRVPDRFSGPGPSSDGSFGRRVGRGE